MKKPSPNEHARPIVSTLFLLSFCISTLADRVTYSYDASGNRTGSQREIVYTRGASNSKSALQKPEKYLDSLSLARIAIYPNPTEGDLRIDITGIEDFTDTELTVRSLNGSVLEHIQPLDVTNEMDLTGYADGVYMVIIRLKDQSTTWKIIKK